MAVWEIELSDGRVIDVESEREPDEQSVMSALQEFESEQPAPPPLEAFSPDVSRSMTPEGGVMATQAGSKVLSTPFNKMSDPLVSLPRFPKAPSQEEIDFAQQFTRIPLPSAGVFEATKGATDVVAETGEFLTSPVGLAAIPALALAGPTAAGLVGLGIGAQMAGSGLGTVSGSNDPETIGRGVGEATIGALMAFAGIPAAKRVVLQSTPRGRAIVELADILEREPMALGPDVYYGLQMQPAYGRSEMIHSFVGPRLKTVLDVMQKLEPERIRLEKVRSEAQAKQQRVRQQEEAVAARREGRPVVPEGPPPQPRVSVIQEIRQRGADTVAKIQELFPQAKLSREQARELRKIAYPPQQPTTGEPSASQVQQTSPIHEPVPAESFEGEGQVPAQGRGAEVQPEAVTSIQREDAAIQKAKSIAENSPSKFQSDNPESDPNSLSIEYQKSVNTAIVERSPVYAPWADKLSVEGGSLTLGGHLINLGYVRDGDRYVFKGGSEVQPKAVTPPRPGGGRSTMEARLREAEAREAHQAPVQQVPAQRKLPENHVVNQDTGAAVAEDLGLRWDGVRTEAGKRKLQFTITEPGPFQGTTFQVGPTVNVGMVKKAIRDKATPEVAGFTKSEKFKGNHELSMEGGELTADFRGKGPVKLEMLNVDPAAQGAGVGSRLMSVLKNTADAQGRGITLIATAIDPSKQAALNRFYERQGFERTGTDKDTGKPIYTREAGKTEAVEPAPVEAVSQQSEPTYPLRTREGGGLEDAEGRPVDAQHRLIERPTKEAPVEPAPVESAPVMEPAEMSVGPGAASPAEFAQRIRRAEAAAPPPSDGPVSVPGGETPTPEVIRKEKDYHIFNVFNSGQWSFYFGRLGENAQAAWSDMALTEFKMRENIARDLQLFRDDILEMLPRAYRKKGGEPFFNAILFKRMPEIEAQFAGKPNGENLVEAARRLKTRLEEIRTTMRDIKRNSYRKFLSNLDKDTVAELFKQNIADPEGRLKGDMADALVMDQYPDDVWFSDGSYLPQLFFGTWKVTVTLKGDKQSQFVTRAETEAQASAEIFNLTRNHPEYKDANFKIEQDTVITPDMIRIGDRAFWDMIGRMKKEALEGVNVKDAVRGIVGRKAGKQKRWGSLLQRMGYAGFSRNFHQTMTAYLSGFHRWKELSALQSRVQPKIEAVRREGRPQAANRLDEIMEYLWGKPHKSTVLFDNFIANVPFLRSYVKPLALARFSRNIRMLARHGMLLTVRYSVVNRLQPIQGLYPMVGERIITQAKIMQHSQAGKKLLDEAGVSFDPGMTRTVGAPIKPRDILGVMTGERSNQEIAFLAMYQHGIESGLSHADAIKYGKLRGQLMTQFTPLITDEAPILSGPILSAMFQFKRFPMKQLELAAIMRRNKMYPGLIRMLLGFFLVGGASFFLGQTWQDKRKQKKLKDALDEGVGDKAADAVMYGLPGLLGADISGSIVLFDEPYGRDFYSKLGRTLTGPAISAPMEITRATMTEPRQPMESSEKARVILNRIPSLRPVANLWALLDEDVDVRSPSGEVRYRRALSEVIAGFGGFRTARESNEAASIDAIMEIEQEGRELKNRFYVSAAGDGDVEGVIEDIQKFNQRWPEYGITMESLSQYVRMRIKEAGKTRGERIAGPKRQHLIDQ